jgi:hypothetical protein
LIYAATRIFDMQTISGKYHFGANRRSGGKDPRQGRRLADWGLKTFEFKGQIMFEQGVVVKTRVKAGRWRTAD